MNEEAERKVYLQSKIRRTNICEYMSVKLQLREDLRAVNTCVEPEFLIR